MREVTVISIALSAALMTTADGPGALAAEWYLESVVQQQIVADDNINLATTDEKEVVGGVLSPQIKVGRRTEVLDLSLTGSVDLNGYVVNSDQSSDEEELLFSGSYITERSRFALDANFDRDTISDNAEDNTGRFTNQVLTTALSVTPSWSYQASELDKVDATGGFIDRSYDSSELHDYIYYFGSLGWAHTLDETNSLSASIFAARNEPNDNSESNSTILSSQLGWLREVSPRTKITASVGPQLILRDGGSAGGVNSEEGLGVRAAFAAFYAIDEQTQFQGSFSHQAEPSGEGVQQRDRVGLSIEHRWTEVVTLTLAGSYLDNDLIAGPSDDDDLKRSFTVEPSVAWRLRQDLDLAASYRFRHQTFRDTDGSAMSNAVFLTLTYRLPRLSWSE